MPVNYPLTSAEKGAYAAYTLTAQVLSPGEFEAEGPIRSVHSFERN
jgi:hypothetical protein